MDNQMFSLERITIMKGIQYYKVAIPFLIRILSQSLTRDHRALRYFTLSVFDLMTRCITSQQR